MRKNNRADDELRPITLVKGYQPYADASYLVKTGETHVVCSVTVEHDVPAFLKGSKQGWITAEYGMLPCSTHTRSQRESAKGRRGRSYEIQRMIGRSLRMMVDLRLLGEKTLRVDCDVLRADGGTRTAAITGAALAVRDAVKQLRDNGQLDELPQLIQPYMPLAAVSAGIVEGRPMLDLDYAEDSKAEADANFVMTADGRLVEVQCTAEGRPITREEFSQLDKLARKGISQLLSIWKKDE